MFEGHFDLPRKLDNMFVLWKETLRAKGVSALPHLVFAKRTHTCHMYFFIFFCPDVEFLTIWKWAQTVLLLYFCFFTWICLQATTQCETYQGGAPISRGSKCLVTTRRPSSPPYSISRLNILWFFVYVHVWICVSVMCVHIFVHEWKIKLISFFPLKEGLCCFVLEERQWKF